MVAFALLALMREAGHPRFRLNRLGQVWFAAGGRT